LLHFSRPQDSTMHLESAIKEFQSMQSQAKEDIDMTLYDHMVAKTLWCQGLEMGYEFFLKALDAGAVGHTPESKDEFLCRVASHLGEGVADFKLVVKLAQKCEIPLSPKVYVAWLHGIIDRRGDKEEHYLFAEKFLKQQALSGFSKDPEVRSALIRVAVHDRSQPAISAGFKWLDSMIYDKQTPSTPSLNALTSWCANERPSRSSLSYGPTHSKLQKVEKAMVVGKVVPTRRVLSNLLAGYGYAGDALSTLGIYRNMQQRGIQLNASDYTFLLHAISSASMPTPDAWSLLADPSRLVNGLFKDIQEAGLIINTNMLNEALRVFTTSLRASKVISHL